MQTLTLADYEVTPEGKIFIKRWNREVKLQPNSKGYLRVVIGGKKYFVHRLVAQKYVPNPENKPQVNHKDGNKLNNRADNLVWATNSENRQHAVENKLHIMGEKCPWSKLCVENVRYIREHKEVSQTKLAKMFGVSRVTIRDIQSFRSWKQCD